MIADAICYWTVSGPSNIRNLFLQKNLEDKPLFILEDESFPERDYTGGTAFQLYEKVKTGKRTMLVESKMLKEEIIKAVKAYENR